MVGYRLEKKVSRQEQDYQGPYGSCEEFALSIGKKKKSRGGGTKMVLRRRIKSRLENSYF